MYLIFDEITAQQRTVEVDYYSENLFRGTMNASWNRKLDAGVTVPNLGTLRSEPKFGALALYDGDLALPVQGSYNTVLDASAAYNAQEGRYSVTIVLGRVEG